jgi:tetratricopeptide (TPR) repeat protein
VSLLKKSAQPATRKTDVFISFALFSLTLILFVQVLDFRFINYDDPFYISQNVHVRQGLTVDSVRWAMTSTEGANWFPVTRLSHLLDAQLFGMESGWHHFTNVLIHAVTAVFLFAFLRLATGCRWPSAFVALIFAIHPLHVESVAWVSERKDVLCAFFWMLALWAYVRHAQKPSAARFGWVILAFALGLMSKPMIVTLPFLLLLLDFWPLRRRALAEKLPLFAMAAASAIVTFLVQRASGAVEPFAAVPLTLRLENAVVAYMTYAVKTLWPSGLAVFYPYPSEIPAALWILAALVLGGISYAVLRVRETRPYLAVGWFWFLLTLLPVIGIVQVGGQERADRYMYVPMIGLLIAAAWGLAQWKRPAMLGAAAAGLGFTIAAWAQTGYWRDSELLFRHAVEVTSGNAVAEHQLGNALLDAPGHLSEAIEHLKAAVQLNPNSANAHNDLGIALARSKQLPEAAKELGEAVRLNPDAAGMHANLATTLADMPDHLPEAISESRAALKLNPDLAEAHASLGLALAKSGKRDQAIPEMQSAVRLEPGNEEFASNLRATQTSDYDLALELAKTPGKLPEAIQHFEAELRSHPENAEAHNNLGFALTHYPQRLPEAIKHFETAIRLNPNYADAHYNLGVALSGIPGRMPEAVHHLEISEKLRPDPELEALLKQLRR